jgi:death-on-curing protein
VAQPRQGFGGAEFYPTLHEKAAALAYFLSKNHGFADGNKRTAWVVARLFLALNGSALRFDPADAIHTMMDVASGSIREEEVAVWFRTRLQARSE